MYGGGLGIPVWIGRKQNVFGYLHMGGQGALHIQHKILPLLRRAGQGGDDPDDFNVASLPFTG